MPLNIWNRQKMVQWFMEDNPGMTKEEAIELFREAHRDTITAMILITIVAEGLVLGSIPWERKVSEDKKGESGKLAAEVEEIW
jgi:hypothetical protein